MLDASWRLIRQGFRQHRGALAGGTRGALAGGIRNPLRHPLHLPCCCKAMLEAAD